MNVDPQTSSSASGNYLIHNIFRGLYRIDAKKGLILEGAARCTRSKLRLKCLLNETKWSNGEKITASRYVESFRRLIDPGMKSPQSEVLFTLKNAREIWDGKRPAAELGVESPDERTLIFNFSKEDPEFEYKLAHPALSPFPPGGYPERENASEMPVNGPYKIESWKRGSRVKLVPNSFYAKGNPSRPPIEALFIEEDSTALTLYESGKLSFDRRVVAADIPRLKGRKDFFQFPMARFDYVGFGPALIAKPQVREALVGGVEFKDFLRIFDTRSEPGCPSLPSRLLEKVQCQTFRPKRFDGSEKLEFQFSKMGGDDIARAVEWFQGQWKKNAGIEVELHGVEQGVYLSGLRVRPPAIFRKGVSLDRPTCLAALEIFLKDSPENFIHLDDKEYELRVQRLSLAKSEAERKRLCASAVSRLLSLNRMIPLGEMHFTILASPKFKGWSLNELNQLDLSQLSGP
jgi:oligopeptide transport system substrate-binding protein